MDRDTVKLLQTAIDEALVAVGEKFKVRIRAGHASYTHSNATFKVEAADFAADGTVVSKEAETFKIMATMYGLEASDLGKEITIGREKYVLTGLAPRSPRFPILATKASDGKTYKLPIDTVCRELGRKPTAAAQRLIDDAKALREARHEARWEARNS